MTTRSGIGIDVHPLVEGRELVLGGVAIPFDMGLSGHSDGDVLTHAVIDAILGGTGLGDIGTHFPSSDPRYEGIASTELLRRTVEMIGSHRWRISYVDATILAERPMLNQYILEMRQSIAACLSLDIELINLKATTTDGLGFVGRGEGIASLVVATIEPTV